MSKKKTSWENDNRHFPTANRTNITYNCNIFRHIMLVVLLIQLLLFHLVLLVSLAFESATKMNGKEAKHCSLCFHNGEPEDFYR